MGIRNQEGSVGDARDRREEHRQPGLVLALRFALREMRGGLKGFYIFLACIVLGVGAIVGVNSVAASIAGGIAAEGQSILGGDAAVSVVQQDLPEDAVHFLAQRGEVSKAVNLRAMARLEDGTDQALVELKAVDGAYPLYGELLGGNSGVSGPTAAQGFVAAPIDAAAIADDEAWVEPLLLERLGLEVGDSIAVGSQVFTIKGQITGEPDRLSEGLGFGPRLMVSLSGLEKAALIRPGSLYTTSWSVRLRDATDMGVTSLVEDLRRAFPESPWRVRSRDNAAPALSRNIERFSQFLTLVGLTALIVGGVGVANSVRAYLDAKRDVIATLKSLGAPGNFVFSVYLFQIMLLALAGVFGGLVLGTAVPFVARETLRDLVPVSAAGAFDGPSLLLGAAYGMLAAFIFAVWPLGKSREIQAAALFRAASFDGGRWPRTPYVAMMLAGLCVLVGLAILFSGNMRIAAIFVTSIAFAFALLRIVSSLIQRSARRMRGFGGTELRMAVANIHRPGSLTPSVVLSLGLGLALISALTLIDGSLRRQVSSNIPKQAPSFFFVDIQNTEMDAFREKLSQTAPTGKIFAVPMLRGRVVELKGIPAEDYKTSEGQWVLRGDRGITYSAQVPENSTLSEGEWWPPDHSGEPLVSFSAEEAGELGLSLGDTIVVNVLGRPIRAKIASLRNVEWETLAINFVMVFSPNTFAGAPHGWLATLTLPDEPGPGFASVAARDGAIMREITTAFPAVTTVRVRDAIETVNTLIGQLATAIRAASGIALIASLLVLSGALAAGNRARTHDAVILKTLGAQRASLIRTFVFEYAFLGLATAIFALAAGAMAAWFVVTQIMEFPAVFDPQTAIATVLIALMVTIGLGLAGTWRILGQKAAPILREL